MRYLLAVLTMSSLSAASGAEVWPQFRGPEGQGHASGTNLPQAWNETENIAWKTEIPGRGWSSPVVADGVIWMTSATETPLSDDEVDRIKRERLSKNPIASQMEVVGPVKLFAVGVDARTGKLVRKVELFDIADPDPIHSLNSYASPSPIVANGHLYCHFGKFGTACVDAKSGKVLWKKQIKIDHSVGPGSSPVLHDGLLIIPCDGTDKQFVIALKAQNGEEVWRTDRPPMSPGEGDLHKAFSTPLVVEYQGVTQVIIPGAQWFVAYEPRSGHELWRFQHGEGFSNVPRPVIANGVAYLCTGFMKPDLCAIRLDGKGDITQTHLNWRHTRQVPTMSSPIIVGGEIYFVADQGVLTCLDMQTGDQVWQKRLPGNYSASPLYVDGKLYFCSREGAVTVLRPGREYDEVAVNELSGQLMASPIVIDGAALVLRSDSHLYRIENGVKLSRLEN
jgi:outer membrane protein assembly factor BamB